MAGVLAVTDDLFFGAKIGETARQLNVPLALVGLSEDLIAKARAVRPGLLILDLNAEGFRPLETIRQVRADPELNDTALLGFCSHVQHDLKVAAAEAGCNRVMARSAFTAQLPEILRPYAVT
jgi:CheY-like chemotaxis protein